MKKTLLKTPVLLFVFLLGGGLILASLMPTKTSKPDLPESTISPLPTNTPPTAKTATAKVKRVIDGDTIELETGQKVRYIGIDTPETVDPTRPVACFGKEATNFNRQLVEGKFVKLEKDVSETDKYQRLLRYVYIDLPDRGQVMVNEELVKEGFAFSLTYPPDVKYQERFLQAQRWAREQLQGLWKSCPIGSSAAPTPNQLGVNINDDTGEQKSGCTIKGNISAKAEKIYHLPGCGSYDKTVVNLNAGEKWFCTENEAIAAGWRKAKNCP